MRFLLEQLPWGLIGSWAVASALSLLVARRVLGGRLSRGAALTIACVVLAVHALLYARSTIDDSFITFRYARNWARGLGPVFQPGERVEGYTSLAWTALLALAGKLGADIVTASKVLGALAGAAALAATLRASRTLLGDRPIAYAAPVVLALQPLFAAWVFSGMETVLFAALLAWAASTLRDETVTPWSAVAFGLLSWVRPEGALFSGCAFVALFVTTPGRRAAAGAALRWLAVCALVLLPVVVWRWSFYHALVPNTFYAKTALSLGSLYSGVVCLGDFALQWGPLGFLCIALSLLAADWRRPLWRFLFIAIPAFAAYVVWAGGDVLHLRFFVHVLPLLVLATLPGLELALETLRGALVRFGPRATPALGAALIVALVTLNFLADGRARATADQFGPSYVINNAHNVRRADRPLGRWLHDHVPPGTRIAAWDIGAIGYESDLPLLDLFGLTDARFARLIHARATPAQLLAALREDPPAYIANYAANGHSRPTWLDGDGGWLARNYEPVSYWPDSPATGILLLQRRGAATVAR